MRFFTLENILFRIYIKLQNKKNKKNDFSSVPTWRSPESVFPTWVRTHQIYRDCR